MWPKGVVAIESNQTIPSAIGGAWAPPIAAFLFLVFAITIWVICLTQIKCIAPGAGGISPYLNPCSNNGPDITTAICRSTSHLRFHVHFGIMSLTIFTSFQGLSSYFVSD